MQQGRPVGAGLVELQEAGDWQAPASRRPWGDGSIPTFTNIEAVPVPRFTTLPAVPRYHVLTKLSGGAGSKVLPTCRAARSATGRVYPRVCGETLAQDGRRPLRAECLSAPPPSRGAPECAQRGRPDGAG